jgi:hypothetical protein
MKKNQLIFDTTIYLLFFGLIAFATYYTSSAYCLWALLLTPSIKFNAD